MKSLKNFRTNRLPGKVIGSSDEVMAAVRAVRKRTKRRVHVIACGSQWSYVWWEGTTMTVSDYPHSDLKFTCSAAQLATGEVPFAKAGQYSVRSTVSGMPGFHASILQVGCQAFPLHRAKALLLKARRILAAGRRGRVEQLDVVRGRLCYGTNGSVSEAELPAIERVAELAIECHNAVHPTAKIKMT